MKAFFRRLGFRKMDEMERMVALKAQRNALLYGVIFLLGWSIYNAWRALATQSEMDTTPSFLLVTMSLVLSVIIAVISLGMNSLLNKQEDRIND